jgi:dihydrofolate reductase
MYLTLIDAECSDADAYFPKFNESDWNQELIQENEDDGIKYKHVLFKRKNRD